MKESQIERRLAVMVRERGGLCVRVIRGIDQVKALVAELFREEAQA